MLDWLGWLISARRLSYTDSLQWCIKGTGMRSISVYEDYEDKVLEEIESRIIFRIKILIIIKFSKMIKL